MRISLFLCLCLVATLGCRTSSPEPGAPGPANAAELVLRGAHIWTADPQHPWAEALAVRDGKIIAIGSEAQVAPLVSTSTKVLELPGKMVLPGFADSHVHPLGAGRQELGCSLAELKTVPEILAKVKGCADASATRGGFVSGRGWNLSLFAQANPHKRLLDEVVPDRPAYFRGEDGHSGWANSRALALAGIDKNTPNPAQGIIERDDAGEPSGTLRESALDLVEKLLPEPTIDDDVAALKLGLSHISAAGITSIMDAGVDERRLEAYRRLAAAGGLPVRVVGCIVIEPGDPEVRVAEAKALRERFAHVDLLRPTATKIFLDGVLEGETAALLAPYVDHKETSGALNVEPAALNTLVTRLEAEGFQVHMHVIGDRATRVALDAYASSQAKNGPHDLRPTLAHLQLIDPSDYPRFQALGVVVNAQSLWAYPDTYIVDINLPQVGQARVDRMYPWASLARAGARIVGGSDWPVSSVNPLDAIEVMVTRQDPRAPGPVLNAAEKLSLDVALAAYTRDAAFLLHQELETGVLAVGKAADLVVLDRDLFAGPTAALNEAQVVMTLLGGKTVFEAP